MIPHGQKNQRQTIFDDRTILVVLFVALILISKLELVTAQTTVEEFIFKKNIQPGPCSPVPLKVSVCNDSLSPENISTLKGGWAKYGDKCDPAKHKDTWGFFWLNPQPEETIKQFLTQTYMGAPKNESCSEFVYQTCDNAKRECGCGLGAVFENGQCKLVEGAGVGTIQCGDDLVPKRVENFAQIIDPRSCLLDFKIECAGTGNCMCHRIGDGPSVSVTAELSNTSEFSNASELQQAQPFELYNISTSPFSFCNPTVVVGEAQLQNTRILADETVKTAEGLKWLSYGQSCKVHENFSSKFKTHGEIKLLIMKWIKEFSKIFSKICNPFENTECDLKSTKCVCSQDFVRQRGKCRLTASTEGDGHTHLSDGNKPGGTGLFGHQACEWYPQFEFFLPHNFDDNNFSRDEFNVSNVKLTSRLVPCVDNAECEDDHGLLKVCKCKKGMICQKTSQENVIGRSQIVNKNLQVLSLCFALIMLFISANPF